MNEARKKVSHYVFSFFGLIGHRVTVLTQKSESAFSTYAAVAEFPFWLVCS